MAKVCSAAQSVDRDTHLGCGVCSESRSGTAPIPNRILREGTYRISSVEFREGILHTLSLRAAVTPNHPTKPSKRAQHVLDSPDPCTSSTAWDRCPPSCSPRAAPRCPKCAWNRRRSRPRWASAHPPETHHSTSHSDKTGRGCAKELPAATPAGNSTHRLGEARVVAAALHVE